MDIDAEWSFWMEANLFRFFIVCLNALPLENQFIFFIVQAFNQHTDDNVPDTDNNVTMVIFYEQHKNTNFEDHLKFRIGHKFFWMSSRNISAFPHIYVNSSVVSEKKQLYQKS
jgi:hypothetical protein